MSQVINVFYMLRKYSITIYSTLYSTTIYSTIYSTSKYSTTIYSITIYSTIYSTTIYSITTTRVNFNNDTSIFHSNQSFLPDDIRFSVTFFNCRQSRNGEPKLDAYETVKFQLQCDIFSRKYSTKDDSMATSQYMIYLQLFGRLKKKI